MILKLCQVVAWGESGAAAWNLKEVIATRLACYYDFTSWDSGW